MVRSDGIIVSFLSLQPQTIFIQDPMRPYQEKFLMPWYTSLVFTLRDLPP